MSPRPPCARVCQPRFGCAVLAWVNSYARKYGLGGGRAGRGSLDQTHAMRQQPWPPTRGVVKASSQIAVAPTGTAPLASNSPGQSQRSATAPTSSTATPVAGPASICKCRLAGWTVTRRHVRRQSLACRMGLSSKFPRAHSHMTTRDTCGAQPSCHTFTAICRVASSEAMAGTRCLIVHTRGGFPSLLEQHLL